MQNDTIIIKAVCYYIFVASSLALFIYIHAIDTELMYKGTGISSLVMAVSWVIGRKMQKIEDAREASRERRKERLMAYYRECEKCGCHLDPGERCDCEDAPLITYKAKEQKECDKSDDRRFERIA